MLKKLSKVRQTRIHKFEKVQDIDIALVSPAPQTLCDDV